MTEALEWGLHHLEESRTTEKGDVRKRVDLGRLKEKSLISYDDTVV